MRTGEYEFQLADDKITLKATPNALRTILAKHGGMRKAIEKIYMMEVDIMEDVIEAGVAPQKIDREILQANVYETGIINLIEPLTSFLILLSNGGKHPEKEQKGTVTAEGES